MTDNDEQLYLVVVEIGPTCIEHGHRLDALPDHVVCLDCSQVARQAALDGLDVDEAILAFRTWSLELGADRERQAVEPRLGTSISAVMDDNRAVARRFMDTYAAGDVDGFLACIADGWVMHEQDGTTSSASDLGEITRIHAQSFPEKRVDWVHEAVEGNIVAQFVRFTLVHTGQYFDLEPTGRHIELAEMIFHRFDGSLIAESWRIVYPDSVQAALRG
jgi:predicted ester cyclase